MQINSKDLKSGILALRTELRNEGSVVKTERWQGQDCGLAFKELLHASLLVPMVNDVQECSDLCGATQPWAGDHFLERVSGEPLNPPPSHKYWLKGTDQYFSDTEKFSHSYPERLWGSTGKGIRYANARLDKAIELLKKEPDTRQCYIPIWFPEDLSAACEGERVPCTFGWHFMKRDNQLHCSYHMRSCDVIRHLHNDLYFANRLAIWLNDEAGLKCDMGMLHFSSTSLHCFENDLYTLRKLCADL